jgi:hypothetical protein
VWRVRRRRRPRPLSPCHTIGSGEGSCTSEVHRAGSETDPLKGSVAIGLRESSALRSARYTGHCEPVPGARLVQIRFVRARERTKAGVSCGRKVDSGGAHHQCPSPIRWALARDQVNRRADAMSCGHGAAGALNLGSAMAALMMAERSKMPFTTSGRLWTRRRDQAPAPAASKPRIVRSQQRGRRGHDEGPASLWTRRADGDKSSGWPVVVPLRSVGQYSSL